MSVVGRTPSERATPPRGADRLASALVAAGTTHVYSLSGNQIMPIYDALFGTGIEIVHTRHEAAAVFMAEAHAQLTGTVGVALVTAAPGVGNAMGALYAARQSETPLLLVSGDAPIAKDGNGPFQELDQVSMSRPIAKQTHRATCAGALGTEAAALMRIAASGRPGPVHLIVPDDVVRASGDAKPSTVQERAEGGSRGAAAKIRAFVTEAERPLILAGPALARGTHATARERLADALCAPVVAMESPRGMRDPALGALAEALRSADRIVLLAKRADHTIGYGGAAPDARWLTIDPDVDELSRARSNLGERLDEAAQADPVTTMRELLGLEPVRRRPEWRESVRELLQRRTGRLEGEGAIEPDALMAAAQGVVERASESVVICDGGEFGQWAQAGGRGTHRVINGPSGAIGGSIPYAIAAAKSLPDASVFAFLGDGTAGFHLAEFETAVRVRAPFVAIIGNDRSWNAEALIQERDYGEDRVHSCELSPARYDRACIAFGGHGEYVERLADLVPAIERALASGLPACIDVAMRGRPAPTVSTGRSA